jgi:hypothetical protein
MEINPMRWVGEVEQYSGDWSPVHSPFFVDTIEGVCYIV